MVLLCARAVCACCVRARNELRSGEEIAGCDDGGNVYSLGVMSEWGDSVSVM